jgi:hypothetical protein
MRAAIGRYPEVAAAAALLVGYVAGAWLGAAVVGALAGGTAGLGIAVWGSSPKR